MMPRWYCDMLPLSVGEEGSGPVLRNRMLGLLHALFAQKPESYALALPPLGRGKIPADSLFGGALRLFASSREDMDWLVRQARTMPWFRDYARVEYPEAVPEPFGGGWVSFHRYRIPSTASDRHGDVVHHRRERRMEEARRQHLEYFTLHSRETGQRFSLFVQCVEASAPQTECQPNCYGLSVTSRPFAVPDLPWNVRGQAFTWL